MKFNFLEAQTPLTKIYRQSNDGLQKTSYPHVYEVTSHTESVTTLRDFELAIKRHAAKNRCLLKGQLTRPLVKESRAGTTNTADLTEWVCLDIDGLPNQATIKSGEKVHNVTITVENLLQELGLGDTSYVIQWSASYGIENQYLRCHVFMFLDTPTPAPQLKQWLISLNFRSPQLSNHMSLTKTGNSISWRLDIGTCQNDKLIYIAPPVLHGIVDPMGKTPRISLVKKGKERITLPSPVASLAKNKDNVERRIAELRAAEGLPKRKMTYKMHGPMEVLVKPDASLVSDMKTERGFVYFNLNGGDSWAYYHPESNPDFIYNFKDEPIYLTKELLPDYWYGLQEQVNMPDSSGLIKLAFLDVESDKYWRGIYDSTSDKLDIAPTASVKALRDHCKANSIPLPDDVVPEWRLIFDPQDNVRVDTTARVINQFMPSSYMRATAKQVHTVPKTIKKVIFHVCGSDQEAYDRFMNWLAYVLQERDVSLTAWIFHGVPGTGKGTLLSRILRPLFGEQHVAMPRMQELESQFNSFVDRSLIVAVDEVETSTLMNERGVMADLRRYITEKHVPLRMMHRTAKLVRNYSSWMFFSNSKVPVRVTKDDRRFNVAKYQDAKLIMTDAEFAMIPKELQMFHDYLLYFKVNRDEVYTPLENADRAELMDLTENAADTVVSAFTGGNFGFFTNQLPSDKRYLGNPMMVAKVDDYRLVLRTWMERTDKKTGKCNLARDELRTVFEYTCGKTPDTPNKFTSFLKHHRLPMTSLRVDGEKVTGIYVSWNMAEWADHLHSVSPSVMPSHLTRVK